MEEAGYTTTIQAWDFKAGNDFIYEMYQAASKAEKTIAVFSPEYFGAQYTHPEWIAAFTQDPTGTKRTLIPVVVRETELPPFFASRIYIDITGLSREEAKSHLLERIGEDRVKPEQEPDFDESESEAHPANAAQYYMGLVNRKKLRTHVYKCINKDSLQQIPEKFCLMNSKTYGFVISGSIRECPLDFQYHLSDLIERVFRSSKPVIAKLNETPEEMTSADQYLWSLLDGYLRCGAAQSAIQRRLEQHDQCYVFYRELLFEEKDIKRQEFIAEMLSAWANLQLTGAPMHILLLVHVENLQQAGWRKFFPLFSEKPESAW